MAAASSLEPRPGPRTALAARGCMESRDRPLSRNSTPISAWSPCVTATPAQQETMPQSSAVFSSALGPSGSGGQAQPGRGERAGGAGASGDLVFQEGRLLSGSLEALMEHLVPTVDYYPDRTYIFTFLLSSRVFMPPHDLLARVGQICLEQRQKLEAGPEKARLKSFSAKIVQLLKEWTEAFPYDFQDEKAMAELKAITHRVTQCDEENGTVKKAIAQMTQSLLLSLAARSQLQELREKLPPPARDKCGVALLLAHAPPHRPPPQENGTVKKAIAQMTQSLLLSLAARSQLQELREKLRPPAVDKGPVLKAKPPAAQKDILGVCCDPLVLAQQLTHIELERPVTASAVSPPQDRVSSIRPEDLMQIISHMDSLDNHRCRGDLTKTYSLEAYDNWFNCLSMLVATEVCRVVKKKHRTRMLEFFIDVARECFNIGNFNSMMAIISGMNLSPVARLKKTWSKVKTAKFDVLEHHMDPSSNFCNYRTALQGATQRSQTANSSREKIVIPVFNLFVKDIYFLHKIHTNLLPNGHVNFKKFWEISRQIHEFMTWTQVECPFEKDKKIQSYLLSAPIYSEEALFVASFESEGPENHMEKDSWKTLRTTLLNRA
ncbi:ras-GEF domain-containing family member 1A [Tupaia chinensis]|uniref:ras-GEF domain-containing family member 1A n=1 Tax=Tupaia chinensis TaxID=246437 RepID=UPI000FFBD353|nr:ras-GEF domain-containing family member 1A [Tupaia chinensis]